MMETQRLPRCTPEQAGIPSSAILHFLEALTARDLEIHSFMLVRHGHVCAEGWWNPYGPELPHMLFSLSKSFTSTAVGLCVDEGRLSPDDPVTLFFPEALPRHISDNLAAMRVRHLLTMSTGHTEDATGAMMGGGLDGRGKTHRDWVRSFLSLPVPQAPGSLFIYNTAATYMLSAIVQRVTGQTLMEYLTPRLFEPLGIEGATWQSCPRGINTGGFGLNVRTEDIAKFGLLYLHKGMWGDRRILSEAWIEQATSLMIENGDHGESDWAQGYGFQFWQCRHRAFRGDGAFGQLCVVMPEQDAVLAMTAGVADMQAELDAVWETLLPAMGKNPRIVKKYAARLPRRLVTLKLTPPAFTANAAAEAALLGHSYALEDDPDGITRIDFDSARSNLNLTLHTHSRDIIRFGPGRWASGTLRSGRERLPVLASRSWNEDGSLSLTLRMITTPFYQTWTLRFDGDELVLHGHQNVSFGPTDWEIHGHRI